MSFALDIPTGQPTPTLYQGNKNVIYTMSGAPGLIVAVRGQLSAPEYIDRVVLKDLSEEDKKTCQIFETKTSSAGTTYYSIRGAGCTNISEKMYSEGIFSINDTRMPGLITFVPSDNTLLDQESIQIPDMAMIK